MTETIELTGADFFKLRQQFKETRGSAAGMLEVGEPITREQKLTFASFFADAQKNMENASGILARYDPSQSTEAPTINETEHP